MQINEEKNAKGGYYPAKWTNRAMGRSGAKAPCRGRNLSRDDCPAQGTKRGRRAHINVRV